MEFDEKGCQRFKIDGIDADLPYDELDDPENRYGFYKVYFDVADGIGNTTETECKVRILGTAAKLLKLESEPVVKQPVPAGCAVCTGTGCGACPEPLAVCDSAQRCADLEVKCTTQGKDCSAYVKDCTDTCKKDRKCAATQLQCDAVNKGCDKVAKYCP